MIRTAQKGCFQPLIVRGTFRQAYKVSRECGQPTCCAVLRGKHPGYISLFQNGQRVRVTVHPAPEETNFGETKPLEGRVCVPTTGTVGSTAPRHIATICTHREKQTATKAKGALGLVRYIAFEAQTKPLPNPLPTCLGFWSCTKHLALAIATSRLSGLRRACTLRASSLDVWSWRSSAIRAASW